VDAVAASEGYDQAPGGKFRSFNFNGLVRRFTPA
jgi:hypothetical protein